MKKFVKAASSRESVVKITYIKGLDTPYLELRSMTVRRPYQKDALMEALEHLDFPYLGYDFNEPDTFDSQDLVDAIMYNNGTDVSSDYIVVLDINGEKYIDNTAPEENY